jgi:phosphodiesterase/alkaline phosphatase D-like protein
VHGHPCALFSPLFFRHAELSAYPAIVTVFLMKSPFLAFLASTFILSASGELMPTSAKIFGKKYASLDNRATSDWWTRQGAARKNRKPMINLDVPRDKVIGFAVYTLEGSSLKMTAQLFPLKPNETQEVRLEVKKGDSWKEIAKQKIIYPGWSTHFRINGWDGTKDYAYRLRHAEKATFEGKIRREPTDKETIVVGNLSCNSSRTTGPRPLIIKNLIAQDPDILFFAGDQTYHHTQHTSGWLEFGMQFRDIMRDRPTITIPDDHDIGQANLWGEGGIQATNAAGPSGGYFYAPEYVNMVQRQQTWHLPDPVDPKPIERNIGVYFTDLTYAGISFAILEDRKFKTGPEGTIPKMGPRPDHINDPKYDRKAVDVKGLKLLGDRQLKFLNSWSQDWTGAEQKVVLSQTAFCGAVHIHGSPTNRLLADLDSNAWPQTGRNNALREIRRANATHLCGDQHLAVSVRHGIDTFDDGPFAFTSPALVNTIYGRWWHPADAKAGPNPVPNSPLPWTGNYLDGLGNKITMLAYANPINRSNEKQRADGYGLARFNKRTDQVTFECYKRFTDITKDKDSQFAGWPLTFNFNDNDGRKATGHLEYKVDLKHPVVQIINERTKEILYTKRVKNSKGKLPIYSADPHTIKVGKDKPVRVLKTGLTAKK